MTEKVKKILKLSQHIEEGDTIRVMGLNCVVKLVDTDHNAHTKRLECVVLGVTESKKDLIVILHWGIPVMTR